MACRKHYRAELLAGAASNQLVSSSLACSVGASDQSHCAGPQLSCGLTLLPCLHHQLLLPAHYCIVLYCTVDIILYFTLRGADTLISPLTRRNGVQRQTVLQSSPPPPPAQQLHLHPTHQFTCKESLVSTANFRDPVSSTHPPHQSLWFAWRASWWDVSTRMPCRSPQALPLTHPTLVPSPHRLSHHILHVTVIVCDLLHDLARSVYNNSHSLIRHRRLPSHWNSIRSHATWSKGISHVDLLIRKFGLP